MAPIFIYLVLTGLVVNNWDLKNTTGGYIVDTWEYVRG